MRTAFVIKEIDIAEPLLSKKKDIEGKVLFRKLSTRDTGALRYG